MSSSDKQNRMNISSVETFFDGLLRGHLTDNLFFGELPVSLKKEWKEMVVVNCANAIRDYSSFGRATVLINLYTKPSAYGIKDVKTMQELETRLNDLVDTSADAHYHISRRGSYQNYNAINDIFINTVQINLIIT